jgi:lipopolysaccharide/colanic/teichoic acid biosynthesis glycosyltransferase
MATRVFDKPRIDAGLRRNARAMIDVRRLSLAARRVMNMAAALTCILVTMPLMLLIAALIRITTRGPVLYKQTRVGLDRRGARTMGDNWRRSGNVGGRPFTIYKFCTMAPSAAGAQVWARPDDERVTRLGRVLRRFRLDELPQFFNVLRGDMNVVGPRPEQPDIFAQLRTKIEYYPHRQQVLPGITGWAQINLSYDRSLDDVRRKVALDLEYIRRQSAVEDAKIMLRTLPVMLGRRGGW